MGVIVVVEGGVVIDVTGVKQYEVLDYDYIEGLDTRSEEYDRCRKIEKRYKLSVKK